MFSNDFNANFPQNTPVKNFLKIGQYMAQMYGQKVVVYVLGHPVQK